MPKEHPPSEECPGRLRRSVGVSTTWGFAVVGVDAVPVRVEAHARSGLPGVTIVGLPGAAVREARERIRSAAASSGTPLPTRRITVNLSPGDIPKDGPGFDLPVALAILAACGCLPCDRLAGVAAVGEVSLEGVVRPTRGTLSAAESAGRLGLSLLIVAVEALPVASLVGKLPVVGVRSLAEAVLVVREQARSGRLQERGDRWLRMRAAEEPSDEEEIPELAEVYGHTQAKRALEIVAAGGHHLLMVGAPGSGKTMLAHRLAGILPPLSSAEAVDVTRVWSAAGLRDSQAGPARRRPFRTPHHTASRTAIVGGGAALRPGEVSLAHRGVLFLDELPEFSRDALEALRQPLEEGRVVVSRRAGTCVFPAACMVVGAMNPCPCGYLGHTRRACVCSAAAIQRYRARVSGPLLDRIDALIEVPPLTIDELEAAGQGETSATVAARVASAREFARRRKAEQEAARMPGAWEVGMGLSAEARDLLRHALASECLGGRGYARVIRLARSIADLDGAASVGTEHLAEALALRLDHRRLGLL
jgi:magnesium chelatase family protein